MVDLQKLVEEELSKEENPDRLIELWKNIFKWHEEGGPENVEDGLSKQFKKIDSSALKSIKEISPVTPKPRKAAKKKVKRRK